MAEDNRLHSERIPKLLLSLAAPAICAQIVTLMYNLVDRIYLGRMADGTLAMAAIGICAPIVTVVTAFTGLLGRGGAPLAAIRMGEGDRESAERYLGNSFSALILSPLAITALVLALQEPLLRLFGTSENTLPYAMEYMAAYICGTAFVQLTVGMNYYITTQGFAKTAMATTMLGAALNIALDPLFIFTLGMGVRGAALATVISQFASFAWVLWFIFGKRTNLKIRRENLRPRLPVLKEIVTLGSAPFFMSLSEGVLHICFNNQARAFGGDVAVSAMTILFSIFQFLLLPVEGVSQGSQPTISYNYGARQFSRVRQTIRLALTGNSAFTLAATAVILAAPGFFIRIFNSDPALLNVGQPMLRVYAAGLFVHGANSTFQQTYNSLGEGRKALFFAFLRKVVLLIPLIYLLPALLPWGVLAVMLAEPVSDILTAAANALYFRRFLQKKAPCEARQRGGEEYDRA